MTVDDKDDVVFPGKWSEQRAKWYLETMDDVVGRQKEPAPGGSETWYVIKEIAPAFASGLFVSTIFLCAGAIEQMLFTELTLEGEYEQSDREYFATIIDKSEKLSIISSDEASRAHRLRKLRNGFFHYRDFSYDDAPSREVLEEIKQSPARPESFAGLHPEAPTMWDYIEPDVKDSIRLTLEIAMELEWGRISDE